MPVPRSLARSHGVLLVGLLCSIPSVTFYLHSDVVDMLRTAMQAGAGRLSRRAASGVGAPFAQAGRRTFSSLQEALVKVTFIDAEVRSSCLSSCCFSLCEHVCVCVYQGTSRC